MRKILVIFVAMFVAVVATFIPIAVFSQPNVSIERVDYTYCSHAEQYIPYRCHLSNGDVLTFENGCWYNQNGKIVSNSLKVGSSSNGKLVMDNYLAGSDVQVSPDYECYSTLGENGAYNYTQMSYANDLCSSGMNAADISIIVILIIIAVGFVFYCCM